MSRGKVVRAQAPASIGNVGPGFDVLGAAVNGCFDEVEMWLEEGPARVDNVSGVDASSIPLEPSKNATLLAADSFLKSRGVKQNPVLKLNRGIPLSAGLGSSAAGSVLGAVAAAGLCPGVPTQSELLLASLAGEEAIAGRHLDNIAPCLLGGVTLVLSTAPDENHVEVTNLPLPKSYWVSLVTPKVQMSTKEARNILEDPTPRSTWVQQMSYSSALSVGVATGDDELIRRSLIDVYAEPKRSVQIPSFDIMRSAALEAGAIGFAISGAGPTCFSLCSSEDSANAVHKAILGAVGVDHFRFEFVSEFGGSGAKVNG